MIRALRKLTGLRFKFEVNGSSKDRDGQDDSKYDDLDVFIHESFLY